MTAIYYFTASVTCRIGQHNIEQFQPLYAALDEATGLYMLHTIDQELLAHLNPDDLIKLAGENILADAPNCP